MTYHQHVTASRITDHHGFYAILCRFVLYIHPKTTSASKYQQLLIYYDIFSWIIALFAVVDENFPNLAHTSEWVLFLPFVPGCTIIETNTAQKKTNLL